jgi:hypothetical protein
VSTKKTAKPRKAGEPADLRPEPRLRLLKPQSECSTTGLVTELSGEVRKLLRGQKRRRKGPAGDGP